MSKRDRARSTDEVAGHSDEVPGSVDKARIKARAKQRAGPNVSRRVNAAVAVNVGRDGAVHRVESVQVSRTAQGS